VSLSEKTICRSGKSVNPKPAQNSGTHVGASRSDAVRLCLHVGYPGCSRKLVEYRNLEHSSFPSRNSYQWPRTEPVPGFESRRPKAFKERTRGRESSRRAALVSYADLRPCVVRRLCLRFATVGRSLDQNAVDKTRRWCVSLKMTTWSRQSRRSEPMILSRYGFCHERGAVRRFRRRFSSRSAGELFAKAHCSGQCMRGSLQCRGS
jgi:hypothetical protein